MRALRVIIKFKKSSPHKGAVMVLNHVDDIHYGYDDSERIKFESKKLVSTFSALIDDVEQIETDFEK